jgi:hypothetical protein
MAARPGAVGRRSALKAQRLRKCMFCVGVSTKVVCQPTFHVAVASPGLVSSRSQRPEDIEVSVFNWHMFGIKGSGVFLTWVGRIMFEESSGNILWFWKYAETGLLYSESVPSAGEKLSLRCYILQKNYTDILFSNII